MLVRQLYNIGIRTMRRGRDNNYAFLDKNLQDKLKQYKIQLADISRQFKTMAQDQKSEWSELMALKCRSLQASGIVSAQLWQTVLALVVISNEQQLTYKQDELETILKWMYVEQMGNKMQNPEIVQVFKDANFNVKDYQTLVYEDPWHVRFSRWLFFD